MHYSRRFTVDRGWTSKTPALVHYKSIKGEPWRSPLYDCRCDEKLKSNPEGSTRLTYTGLLGGLENLKIKTRLVDERFASVL
jgi:hypothetical protein